MDFFWCLPPFAEIMNSLVRGRVVKLSFRKWKVCLSIRVIKHEKRQGYRCYKPELGKSLICYNISVSIEPVQSRRLSIPKENVLDFSNLFFLHQSLFVPTPSLEVVTPILQYPPVQRAFQLFSFAFWQFLHPSPHRFPYWSRFLRLPPKSCSDVDRRPT